MPSLPLTIAPYKFFRWAADPRFPGGILIIADQKAQNTDGGTFTLGAWRTRTLNTVIVNTITGASLASNQITLPAGIYRVTGEAPGYSIGSHQAIIKDVTNTVVLVVGSTEKTAGTNTMTSSKIFGRFTLTAQAVVELQHRSTTTQTTNGFGLAANFTTEVYSQLRLEQE